MRRISATAVTLLLAAATMPGAASAQVNCYAANDPGMRAHCQRQMIEIHRGYGQAQDQIIQDLNRAEQRADQFMGVTPWWSRGTWNGVRGGYYGQGQ